MARRTTEEDEIELTEEEREEYEKGIITWSKATRPSFWFRKEWTWYYVIFVVIVVLVALMAFFHHRVSELKQSWSGATAQAPPVDSMVHLS